MDKRMNKEELIELIKTLKISKEEFWVLSSGALVLRGIFPDAGDLDIAVTNKGLEKLKENYNLEPKNCGLGPFYKVTDNIECVCDGEKEKLKYQPEKVGEFYVQNIYEYYEYLKGSEREKDKLRIPLVEEYIKNNY
jgi:hypothetical protein